MSATGKYDFPGIKKAGATGLKVALASTTWGAFLVNSPVLGKLVGLILQFIANWLANNGLVVLNLGAIFVSGEFDQMAFDKALHDGIQKVESGRDKITPAQGKAIDDEVRKAASKFIRFSSKP